MRISGWRCTSGAGRSTDRTIARATRPGVCTGPSGAGTYSGECVGAFAKNSVSVLAGSTSVTLMPVPPSSPRRAWVRPVKANLLAA